MIHRRGFICSVGAICAASSPHWLLAAPNVEANTLNWKCDVIQTVPHSKHGRAPVVTGVSLQPFGQQMAVVGDDHYICVYDFARREFVKHIGHHSDWVRAAKFCGNGQILATAGNDRKLYLWQSSDWNARPLSIEHSDAIIAIEFSADSRQLATVGFESVLRIYDVESGLPLKEFVCDCPDNHAISFSNDGQWVAAGGRSGVIHVWDTRSGNLVSEFKAHRKRIRSLQFTPNNRMISAGDDQIVLISNPLNQNQQRAFPRHRAKLYDVELIDHQYLVTAGSDNLIHIWKMQDATEIGVLKGHTGTVSCLDAQQGKLISGSYDTQVRVWHMEGIGARQTRRTLNHGNRQFK